MLDRRVGAAETPLTPVPAYEIKPDGTTEFFVRDLRRRFIYSITALLGIVIISTVGLVVLGESEAPIHDRVFLALWDTLSLISTVGDVDEQLTPGQRVFAMLVIIFGLGAVLTAFSTLLGLFQGTEVRQHLMRKRMQRTLAEMEGHIVLCGYGHVGREVARHVRRAGRELVVIAREAAAAAVAARAGFLVIRADATGEETLKLAGIERATGLIAALDNDASNVYLILIARELKPDLRIVARADRESSRSTLRRAGASRVLVPGEIAGLQLSQLVLKPHMSEFLANAVGEGEYDFAEVDVSQHPSMQKKSLRELNLPHRAEVIVISVITAGGDQIFSPPADRVLEPDDTLLIVSRVDALKNLETLERLD
jgi:voltage-gated potassium channel